MNDDEDIPLPARPRHRTREELDAMTENLWNRMQALQAHVDRMHTKLVALEDDEEEPPGIARWLPFAPPPAAEDKRHRGETPLFTIAHFVEYYNATYVGNPGTRAIPIPDCWLTHPGLLAELATLTYTWRAAHLGKTANVRDAQYWHDRWRVGFAERLATEWVHHTCHADGHKEVGSPMRQDRFSSRNRPVERHVPQLGSPPRPQDG